MDNRGGSFAACAAAGVGGSRRETDSRREEGHENPKKACRSRRQKPQKGDRGQADEHDDAQGSEDCQRNDRRREDVTARGT